MGHERYDGAARASCSQRPVDELARRLFAAGGVEKVHINGSVVTVTLGGGQTGAGLGDVVRDLFLHYGDDARRAGAAPTDEADATPEALADPPTRRRPSRPPTTRRPPSRRRGPAERIEASPRPRPTERLTRRSVGRA